MNNDTPHTYDPATPYGTHSDDSGHPQLTVEEFDAILRLAIGTYGKESRTQMLFEEMAELQNALCKLARGRDTIDHVCEEIADVLLVCYQLALIFGTDAIGKWANIKALRLRELLNKQP